jgi:hypothetical protein
MLSASSATTTTPESNRIMILFQVYLLQTLVYRPKALDGLVLVSKVFGSCAQAKPTTWRLLDGAEPQLPCDRAVLNIWALGLKNFRFPLTHHLQKPSN